VTITEWKTSAEQPDETLLTVRLVILLLERALVELALTVRAHKVLGVVLAEHCCHTAAGHRLVTSNTQWPTSCMEVRFTIRQTFVVEETFSSKWCATFLYHNSTVWFNHLTIPIIETLTFVRIANILFVFLGKHIFSWIENLTGNMNLEHWSWPLTSGGYILHSTDENRAVLTVTYVWCAFKSRLKCAYYKFYVM